jgi:hypothetical protein
MPPELTPPEEVLLQGSSSSDSSLVTEATSISKSSPVSFRMVENEELDFADTASTASMIVFTSFCKTGAGLT